MPRVLQVANSLMVRSCRYYIVTVKNTVSVFTLQFISTVTFTAMHECSWCEREKQEKPQFSLYRHCQTDIFAISLLPHISMGGVYGRSESVPITEQKLARGDVQKGYCRSFVYCSACRCKNVHLSSVELLTPLG